MLSEENELKLKELRGEIITSVNKFNKETGTRVIGLDLEYYPEMEGSQTPQLARVNVTMKDK